MSQPIVSTNTVRPGSASRAYGNKLFLLSLPFVVLVFAFCYVPIFGWIYAFFRYIPGIPLFQNEFAGLDNFKFLFSDTNLVRVLVNTLAMSFLGLACSVLPVILAIMLTEVRNKAFKKIVQTTTTLPYFVSWIIVYSLAFSIFSADGVLNFVLSSLHLTDKPVLLLGNANIVWGFMTILSQWKNLGWSAIVYLAAIAGIDSELYEAAKIDGAGRFKSIVHITIPGVAPTFLVLLLLSISSLLNTGLDQYLMFYNSIVADKIEVLDYYVYRVGIKLADYSYGTAVGMIKSLIAIILLFTANFAAKKIRGESIV